LQPGTSDELGRSESNVVAIGLDRPFSDVQVNISSSSSSKDESHQYLPRIKPEVGTRSSECRYLQVDLVVSSGIVMGVGILPPCISIAYFIVYSIIITPLLTVCRCRSQCNRNCF